MIHELRIYWAEPGKIENLHERFRSLTLGLFKRHSMEVVAFWTPVPATPESGDLVYILRFANTDAMKAAWAAFQNDPDWIAGKAASEINGKLVTRLTSQVLSLTDYSPQI